MIVEHSINIKIFYGNEPKEADEIPTQLMNKVMPFESDSLMNTCDNLFSRLICLGTLLGF